MQKNKKILVSVGLLALLFLAVFAVIANYNFKYKNTAFPNIYLNGYTYSGSAKADAKTNLESQIQETYKDGIKLAYQDKTFIVSLAELGLSIDTEKSIENVFSYGHKNNLLENIKEQTSLLQNKIDFQNEVKKSDFLIENSRWQEISKIETPVKNFSYEFNGTDFEPAQAAEGLVIDQKKLEKDIAQNLEKLKNEEIKLELVKKQPDIEKDTNGQALQNAKNIVEKQIVLKYNSSLWKVAKEDFGQWIDFAVQAESAKAPVLGLALDKVEVNDYLTSLVPQINSKPVNAQLEFKDGKVNVFALSQDGIEVNITESIDKMEKEIFQAKNYTTGNQAAEISIELAISKIKPELSTDNIDNMGITTLLATGESNFSGSSKSRKHNITVGASKFNGVLIGPGDEFSFNQILGNVGAKEGYLPEFVIKQGKTVPEYGGGLCQVSTTAFRGAIKAGLDITERKNHAYAVSYYSPQGTDATIYPPHPDLAFINNTPAYILIQTRISGNNLYFDFYGTSDGRKVKTEGPVVYERGTGGAMKTWWKQKVYDKDGNLFLEETFYSNYKSPSLYPHTNPLE